MAGRRNEGRPLPADLFTKMLNGQIDSDEATALAERRWERETAGGSMNDRIRGHVLGLNDTRENARRPRNARGEFIPEGDDSQKVDMNEMLRAALGGVRSEQGTIEMKVPGVDDVSE